MKEVVRGARGKANRLIESVCKISSYETGEGVLSTVLQTCTENSYAFHQRYHRSDYSICAKKNQDSYRWYGTSYKVTPESIHLSVPRAFTKVALLCGCPVRK